jgi:hypothetical protein
MSRSIKIPILKQKHHNYKRTYAYWRPIRSRVNQIVRGYATKYDDSIYDLDDEFEDKFDLEINVMDKNSIMLGTDIPNPRSLINDWDYCDWFWDYRSPWHDEEDKIKYSRK